jgi:hypothetical protein
MSRGKDQSPPVKVTYCPYAMDKNLPEYLGYYSRIEELLESTQKFKVE